MRLMIVLLVGLFPTLVFAAPQFGRYMPLYPGQYLDLSYETDEGDRAFDANGRERDSAVQSWPDPTAWPRDSLNAALTWHFPWFESYGAPFISSRTWMARISLRHARTSTRGGLTAFINDTSDDASTDADDLRNNGSGIGDMSFEFGTYLFGSPTETWRVRDRSPLALLALLGFTANFGAYDRDAPVSAGSNSPSAHAQMGLHWQPWPGAFLDAGLKYTEYFKNQDPAFGALAPAQQGSDLDLDLSLGQRLLPGLYLNLFATAREGGANVYENPRFAPNPPSPPPGSDTYPTPGRYRDGGTALRTLGVSLSWFVTQRLRLSLDWTRPVAGESGAFELPYTIRTPEGCTAGATGCSTVDGERIITDGFGPARVLASDRLSLHLSFSFLERDTFNCRGCSE